MKTVEFTAIYEVETLVKVIANSEEEALKKFYEGDIIDEYEIDCRLQDILSIKNEK